MESLSLDEAQCRFIGELVDVQEAEAHWQGAIERALGGLRTTLVVPEQSFRMITRWLNAQHTGLHVRVQVVNSNGVPAQPPVFRGNGYLRKLVWREHPYREWIKYHLKRFDLQCVDDTAELDSTPFSMTREGLIHKEQGRFEKKDLARIDDRRQWFLGFSNTSRLALLEAEHKRLEIEEATARKTVEDARRALDAIATQRRLWETIRGTRWDDIDLPHWENRASVLTTDLAALEEASGNLAQAKVQWEEAKQALRDSQAAVNDLNVKRGAASQSLQQAETQREQTAEQAGQLLDDRLRMSLDKRVARQFGTLGKADLARMGECQRQLNSSIDSLLDVLLLKCGMHRKHQLNHLLTGSQR